MRRKTACVCEQGAVEDRKHALNKEARSLGGSVGPDVVPPYIWGAAFVVRTDNASLRRLFRQNANGQLFRMLQTPQEYNFKVFHWSGDKHGCPA